MRLLVFQTLLAVLAAVCLLAFHPLAPSVNLVKELLWWGGLPAVAGSALLGARRRGLLVWGCDSRRFFKEYRAPLVLLAVFFAWSVVGAWRAPDAPRAWVALARLAGYILTFVLVATIFGAPRGQRRLLHATRWACLLAALYTLAQYVGFDIVEWQDKSRPFGTFGNPNFIADCLSAFLPLSIIWEIRLRGRWPAKDGARRGLSLQHNSCYTVCQLQR